MTDDIVARLRNVAPYATARRIESADLSLTGLVNDAADEIERLRAMCDQFAESAKMFGTQWGSEVVDFRINQKKLKRAWLKYMEMRNG